MVGATLGIFAIAVPLAFLWRNYWVLVAGIVAGVDPPHYAPLSRPGAVG